MPLNKKNLKAQEILKQYMHNNSTGDLGNVDLKPVAHILADLHDLLSAMGPTFDLARRETMRLYNNTQDILTSRNRYE